jgi:glutathione synthase/RimK-type ligase-like ATP-grasp enzyme
VPAPRIAIATCADHADLKVDDELLRGALGERGVEAIPVVWDEPRVDWSEFDLCLVRSTWDYHEKHAEFLAWAQRAGAATALRNPADLIAWNSDKTYLRELAEAGVPTIPTLWVERGSDFDPRDELRARGWIEAVVKPVVDLGAKNLHRVGVGEVRGALATVLARQEAMVQPFLPSLEADGELSLVYIGGSFSHAARKRPAGGDFRVQLIWGGTMTPADPEPRDVEVAERALAQLDEPPLYARVDLVTGPDGEPCLIELELIEPNLYLGTTPAAAERLADAVLAEL